MGKRQDVDMTDRNVPAMVGKIARTADMNDERRGPRMTASTSVLLIVALALGMRVAA
jgi:hypothetical protein